MDTRIVASGCGESNGNAERRDRIGRKDQKENKNSIPFRNLSFCFFRFFGQSQLTSMKHLPRIFALATLLLAACASPPPAPGDKAFHGKQNTAYRLGYHHGFMDGSKKLDDNFERYHDEYLAEGRDAFARGYQIGHEAGRHDAAADDADQDRAFQNGYDAGAADAVNSTRPDHTRYRSQFSTAAEPLFREGYEKGWHDARAR